MSRFWKELPVIKFATSDATVVEICAMKPVLAQANQPLRANPQRKRPNPVSLNGFWQFCMVNVDVKLVLDVLNDTIFLAT